MFTLRLRHVPSSLQRVSLSISLVYRYSIVFVSWLYPVLVEPQLSFLWNFLCSPRTTEPLSALYHHYIFSSLSIIPLLYSCLPLIYPFSVPVMSPFVSQWHPSYYPLISSSLLCRTSIAPLSLCPLQVSGCKRLCDGPQVFSASPGLRIPTWHIFFY